MATLILQDGTVIKGESFGALGGFEGEVVFNTTTTGYQDIFMDPAYAKQIVIMTYPEIGNCGMFDHTLKPGNPNLVGIVVKESCKQESHYRSRQSLSEYLQKNHIIGIKNVDTRSLVKKIRDFGEMSAFITSNDVNNEFVISKVKELQSFNVGSNIVSEISIKDKYILNPNGDTNIAFIDLGTSPYILDRLVKEDCRVTVFPAEVKAEEILTGEFSAVFLSNGPGNPSCCVHQIKQLRELIGKIPLFGISLGCQLLAMTLGAKIHKLTHGHRGANHPVINLENNKVIITTQNHSYNIDSKSLTASMRQTYKNLNDDTLEGFEITSLGVYGVQFYPEANLDIHNGANVLDEWLNIINSSNKSNGGI